MRLIWEDEDLEILEEALRHYGDSFNAHPPALDIPELMSETEKATRKYNQTMSQKVRRLWRILHEINNEVVEVELP